MYDTVWYGEKLASEVKCCKVYADDDDDNNDDSKEQGGEGPQS